MPEQERTVESLEQELKQARSEIDTARKENAGLRDALVERTAQRDARATEAYRLKAMLKTTHGDEFDADSEVRYAVGDVEVADDGTVTGDVAWRPPATSNVTQSAAGDGERPDSSTTSTPKPNPTGSKSATMDIERNNGVPERIGSGGSAF